MEEYCEICYAQSGEVLDRRISYEEIKRCLESLKNNKAGGN